MTTVWEEMQGADIAPSLHFLRVVKYYSDIPGLTRHVRYYMRVEVGC